MKAKIQGFVRRILEVRNNEILTPNYTKQKVMIKPRSAYCLFLVFISCKFSKNITGKSIRSLVMLLNFLQISHVEGVHDHTQFHAWQLKSGVNVASIHVKVSDDANDQIVRQRINQILRKYGATQISVQVEKEAFIRRLNASYSSNHHQRSEHYHSKMNNGGHAALNLGYG